MRSILGKIIPPTSDSDTWLELGFDLANGFTWGHDHTIFVKMSEVSTSLAERNSSPKYPKQHHLLICMPYLLNIHISTKYF